MGGQGGAGGAGGPVTVTNGTGGTILTQGVAAFGIFAQSVGGGGGEGSLAGTVNGSLQSLGMGIGGNGGGGGDGGVVTVTTGDGDGSTITTTGKHGIAIFAQSVGGGGGLVRTMTTDETFDPSKIVSNPQGRLADVHGFSLNIGGQNGSSGAGGDVNVFASGPITTSGLDAHAILAQSIGAGGGMAVGGQFASVTAPATGGASGDGGTVKIELQPGAKISTSGAGAYGILAQSIGGGGGAAGDFSHAPDHLWDLHQGLCHGRLRQRRRRVHHRQHCVCPYHRFLCAGDFCAKHRGRRRPDKFRMRIGGLMFRRGVLPGVPGPAAR